MADRKASGDGNITESRHGRILLWVVVAVILLLLVYQVRSQGFNGWTLGLLLFLVVILLRDFIVKLNMPGFAAEFEHPKMQMGGKEIAVEEVTEQIREQLGDLQQAITSLNQLKPASGIIRELRVLWISPNPTQSAVLLTNLREDKIVVSEIDGVDGAIAMLKRDPFFDVVVFDLVANEQPDTRIDDLGELDQLLQRTGRGFPVAVYASRRALLNIKRRTSVSGLFVTASATDLRNYLSARRPAGNMIAGQ
jgi:CheY-like chemotaxis protein